jgi:hypothetical protein
MWQPMHGKGLAQYRRKGDGDAWRGRQGRADYSRPRARAGQSHHHGQGGRRCGRSDQRLRACTQMRTEISSSQRTCAAAAAAPAAPCLCLSHHVAAHLRRNRASGASSPREHSLGKCMHAGGRQIQGVVRHEQEPHDARTGLRSGDQQRGKRRTDVERCQGRGPAPHSTVPVGIRGVARPSGMPSSPCPPARAFFHPGLLTPPVRAWASSSRAYRTRMAPQSAPRASLRPRPWPRRSTPRFTTWYAWGQQRGQSSTLFRWVTEVVEVVL